MLLGEPLPPVLDLETAAPCRIRRSNPGRAPASSQSSTTRLRRTSAGGRYRPPTRRAARPRLLADLLLNLLRHLQVFFDDRERLGGELLELRVGGFLGGPGK